MAEPAPRAEAAPISAPSRGFPWYVAGVATWFGAFGMQQVLFSWLVVGELHAEARWVGVAQSASIPTSGRRARKRRRGRTSGSRK